MSSLKSDLHDKLTWFSVKVHLLRVGQNFSNTADDTISSLQTESASGFYLSVLSMSPLLLA